MARVSKNISSMDITFPILDAHVHFWDLKKIKYLWPTSEEKELFRNFTPTEYLEAVKEVPVVKNAIFIQATNNCLPENDWVLELARQHKWLVGVIGWVDLTDAGVEKVLKLYAENECFLGVRHVTELELPDWLGREDVHEGLRAVEKLNLTFDLLLKPHNLHYAPQLAKMFPKLRLIIDHLAKPNIKAKEIDDWKKKITRASKYQNVCCKLSGMITEADWENWRIDDFKPYITHCVESFGPERCLFGSDFPVYFQTSISYKQLVGALYECLLDCATAQEIEGIFYHNAIRIYNIKSPLNMSQLSEL